MLTRPNVKLIADSINSNGDRISTFQLKYWRPILPEMNTHRVFSRNAASSRAQSFNARCEQINERAYIPCHWNAEQPGMVGGEEFSEEVQNIIGAEIQTLAQYTTNYLKKINEKVNLLTGKEIHKQYLNRYLEPFCQVTQLVTSTEWDNFLNQRMANDAQPEIHDVARLILDYLVGSQPVERRLHLPYVTKEEFKEYGEQTAIKISVARCARVSYKAYEGESDFEKDLRLYNRLLTNGHWSPFEHVAFADPDNLWPEDHRNFKGWCQYRAKCEY